MSHQEKIMACQLNYISAKRKLWANDDKIEKRFGW